MLPLTIFVALCKERVPIVHTFDGWLVYGVRRHFQQYFSYIVAVSCIGGGNQRKPLTCH